MSARLLSLPGGAKVEVEELGSGPKLLYLHGIWDAHDSAFLDALSKTFTVVRLYLPGFGRSTGEELLLDVHDAIYHLLDVLDALDFRDAPLLGHCLGGMFAAELAAVQPRRFTRLGLIAPFGLWSAEHPTLDFFAAAQDKLTVALYGSRPPASAPADEPAEARAARIVDKARAMEAAARFLWPLPNRGLDSRAHRIAAPTLIVWGSADRVAPPSYGADFQRLIAGSELRLIEGAAHMPQAEQPEAVAAVFSAFLSF